MDTLHDETIEVTADQLAWLNDPANGYRPTLEEEAEEAGYRLGWDGDPRPDVADLTVPTAVYQARVRGYIVGRCRRAYHDELARLRAIDEEQERIDFEMWLAGLAREREIELMMEDARGWHEAERVEAVGSVEARKG